MEDITVREGKEFELPECDFIEPDWAEFEKWDLGYPGNEETAKAYFSSTAFNPVLMVKDFDSREAFAVSEQFMTNADTPTLAFRELIENPWNPFLDHAVTDADKGKQEQKICMADWHINPADFVFGGSYSVWLNPEAQTVE